MLVKTFSMLKTFLSETLETLKHQQKKKKNLTVLQGSLHITEEVSKKRKKLTVLQGSLRLQRKSIPHHRRQKVLFHIKCFNFNF